MPSSYSGYTNISGAPSPAVVVMGGPGGNMEQYRMGMHVPTLPPHQAFREHSSSSTSLSSSSRHGRDELPYHRGMHPMHQPLVPERELAMRRVDGLGYGEGGAWSEREKQLVRSRADYLAGFGEDIFETLQPTNINKREQMMGRQLYYYFQTHSIASSSFSRASPSALSHNAAARYGDDYYTRDSRDVRAHSSVGRRRRRHEYDGDHHYRDERTRDDSHCYDEDKERNDSAGRQHQRRRHYRSESPSGRAQHSYHHSYSPNASPSSAHGTRNDAAQSHQSLQSSSGFDDGNRREDIDFD